MSRRSWPERIAAAVAVTAAVTFCAAVYVAAAVGLAAGAITAVLFGAVLLGQYSGSGTDDPLVAGRRRRDGRRLCGGAGRCRRPPPATAGAAPGYVSPAAVCIAIHL